MIAVAFAPVIDPGYYDFRPRSLTWLKSLGVIMSTVGFVICVRGVHFLRRTFTVSAQPKEGTRLVTDGPFRYTRNPMYLGGLLMCFGWSLSQGSGFGVICSTALFVILLMKIRMEEAYLETQFGNDYQTYKKRVKKLIPYVY